MRFRCGRFVVSLAAVAVVVSGYSTAATNAVTGAGGDRPVSAGTQQATARTQQSRTVTLITGDRVVVSGTGANDVGIIPGEGRHVLFRTRRIDGKVTVVPSDVEPLLASGRLDPRLFDVTGLIRDGYDDSLRKTIPLIVTYDGATGRASVRGSGAESVRELPSVNGTAVRITKGTKLLETVPAGGARFGGGIEKIWLDGRRHTTLDQSVPQIGVPAAWQAGYTGRGVTVAVLDTGVDATHPDLADRVAEARNFTTEPAGDLVGHGTHVASTIAGTAAASDGKYKGVAPDATLLDGKVCELFGCLESEILAGLQWAAVDKHADVINMSLGGSDGPEVDPLEEAVNTLTAQTGALFVVAAGNEGPATGTVGSPGSADAALTVGAVDKQDDLAEFSSRGPRIGDGAVKPDVTAPGVAIVAARSKDGSIGVPIGERYVRLSGTSMATPHTAGAAALLAQQHPDWTATDLKAALMSSAKPHPGQGVFDQGSGRVDVARAIAQAVVGQPGSVSFGIARWPHNDDEPVTRNVTYRNHGSADVTLHLQAVWTGPDGRPAPDGTLTMGASSVTVPAGGTETVTVTSDTRTTGPDGRYSGRIVATGADGIRVTTPLAAEREEESYDLTVSHVDPDGKPAPSGWTGLTSLDGSYRQHSGESDDGTRIFRLSKARYFLEGSLSIQRPGDQFDAYETVQPIVDLHRDTTVVIDARLAKEVRTTVPRSDAERRDAGFGVHAVVDGVEVFTALAGYTSDVRLFTAPLGDPVAAPNTLNAYLYSLWAVQGPEGRFENSPYSYNLYDTQQGQMFRGLDRVVKDGELARLTVEHNAQSEQGSAVKFLFAIPPGFGAATALSQEFDLPSRTIHYLDVRDIRWRTRFHETVWDDEHGIPLPITELFSPYRTHRAGRSYPERWNAAVIGPSVDPEAMGPAAVRGDDQINAFIPLHSDQDGHPGISRGDSDSTQLFYNGDLLEGWPSDGLTVPAEPGEFRLATTVSRPSFSDFSTRIDAEWTFRSRTASSEGEVLPLWAVRYFPSVDSRNAAKRQSVTVLPLKLEADPNAKVGKLTNVDVQVSGDDGTTWANATVRRTGDNRYVAVFATPAGRYVSLKAKAADSDGNTTEQTIIRAYALR